MYDRNKMYKRRIKQWGLDKNNKDDEMRAIVRKTKARLRQGKRSKIHVRGKEISDEEVIRYWKRKGISIDDVIAHRAASVTPEAVNIVTPVPSRVATPLSLALPERIFTAIRDYCEGSFASGNWGYEDPSFLCYTRKVQGDPMEDLNNFVHDSVTARKLFSYHRYQEAGRILDSVFSNFKKILLAEHPETLSIILGTVICFRLDGWDEVGMAILRHFCALGEFVVGKQHPLRLICGWLASADAFQSHEIIAMCFQSMTDQMESFVGPMHYSTLVHRAQYINEIISARDQCEELLQKLLEQCELHLGSSDLRTHHLRYQLARHYYTSGQYAEALRMGQDLIAHIQYSQSPNWYRIHYYTTHLVLVALSQWALGEMSSAEANFREAIAVRVSEWGTRDSRAGLWLVQLEDMLLNMGRWSCADEVRNTRMSMLDPTEVL